MLILDQPTLDRFYNYLSEMECSEATVGKYLHDVKLLQSFCKGNVEDKGTLIAFKQYLQRQGYAPSSINSMLAAVNRFLAFAEVPQWRLRLFKIQRTIFTSSDKELTQHDYEKLLQAAYHIGNERLALLVQTICATGIRVSEVRAITLDSVKTGQAEIRSKGKIRVILLPRKLCRILEDYCKRRGVQSGPVFVTRSGKPLDRSNIWKSMKRLAAIARVAAGKVFPHNLRHLFARTYYKAYKDIVRLADILGHTSVDTTRIYTTRTGIEQQRQIERLPLLI